MIDNNYRAELKAARGYLMPRSRFCIMDLPALPTIPFLHGNGLAGLRTSPCQHRKGLFRADSVLAYGHHTSSVLAYDEPMLARDGHQDGHRVNRTDKVKT